MRSPTFTITLATAFVAMFGPLAATQASTPTRVLFVRGGSGTGGFINGGGDGNLSDLFDFNFGLGNSGYGELGMLLAADGYAVQQIVEGSGGGGVPIPLLGLDLAQYDVIVFASNNAMYDALAADRVLQYVCAGGSALFISDANWGSSWSDAPNSDQTFLRGFDLRMNQDGGTYALSRSAGDFVVGGVDRGMHPVLAGPDGIVGTGDDVNGFDGEGVSPATVTHFFPGVEPIVLAGAKGLVHRNDSLGNGSFSPATIDDAALVVAEYGAGRVACHFDRNTFFNLNGAGTSLHVLDNAQLARNLFAWLAGEPGPVFGKGCPGTGGFTPSLTLIGCAKSGASIALALYGGCGGSPTFFLVGTQPASLGLGGSCALLTAPLFPQPIGPFALPGAGPGTGTLSLPATIPQAVLPTTVYAQAFVVDAASPTGFAASNAVTVAVQ